MRNLAMIVAAAGARMEHPPQPTRIFVRGILDEPDEAFADPRNSRAAAEAARRAEMEFGGPAR